MEFEQKIRDAVLSGLNGQRIQHSIYEGLGTVFMDAFVTFKSEHGENIGFIPVFREDSPHTEAVIITTLKNDIPHYAILQRGHLYPYAACNDFDNSFPTINVMADVFVSFDNAIFENTNSVIRDIIGSAPAEQRNETAKILNFEDDSVTDIKSEWVGTEECLFTFVGTHANPYQYLTNIDCQTSWSWQSVPSYPEILDAGGGGGGSGLPTINLTFLKSLRGKKPLKEYNTKCNGLQDMWNSYPNNEVLGYITADGKVILTDILSQNGGSASGLYEHKGTSYYSYPASQGKPSQDYAGMRKVGSSSNPYYLIPVSASVHTHSPCRSDGSNGISHQVGNEDKAFASSHNLIKHWVIGCDAIGEYNGTNDSFFNKKIGNINQTCKQIN